MVLRDFEGEGNLWEYAGWERRRPITTKYRFNAQDSLLHLAGSYREEQRSLLKVGQQAT